jgi:hypothetical protein
MLLGALPGAARAGPAAVASGARGAAAHSLAVRNLFRRYGGDHEKLATVVPGMARKDTAAVGFELSQKAHVKLEAVRIGLRQSNVAWSTEGVLEPGSHELRWQPGTETAVGSYVMRLTVEGDGGRRIYGARRPSSPDRAQAPVVRVLGLEAAFTKRSYVPGEPMQLSVFVDAPRFKLTFLRTGYGPFPSLRNDEMTGQQMADPITIEWSGKRTAPATIRLQTGLSWPTGVYAARLETKDGRVGFAPFVLRPPTLGTIRVAVVVPTNTWQAYNLYDSDGDGWGDTWYVGGLPPVHLRRPYLLRGVPPRFRRYDYPFLRWLERYKREAEFLAEDDLDAMQSGDELKRLYDLVVFPGHTEYVTEHEYDVVERYRDLGGRLIFLSANNFFWKVDKSKDGDVIRRVKLWRTLGRPEARLCGVQYRANDDGSKQGVYYVLDAETTPWLFAGTELEHGSTIGDAVGGYGVEIDSTTKDSPPGTTVIGVVPSLFGPGLHAEMAYYETEAGARVFSAGSLDFCGSVLNWPMWKMLDNLWLRMLAPAEEPGEKPDAPGEGD